MSNRNQDDSFFGPSGSGSSAQEREVQLLQLRARRRPQEQPQPSSEPDYTADATFFGTQQGQMLQGQLNPQLHAPVQTPPHQPQYASPPYEYPEESFEEYPDNDIELDSYDTESSNAFDPDEDPEGWAERIDELAGVLEMSEAEARALRWGPAIGAERGAPDLPVEEFQQLLDHHLETTEWRFDESIGGQDRGGDSHPIPVLGRGWGGKEAGERIDPSAAMRQLALENGVGVVA